MRNAVYNYVIISLAIIKVYVLPPLTAEAPQKPTVSIGASP